MTYFYFSDVDYYLPAVVTVVPGTKLLDHL